MPRLFTALELPAGAGLAVASLRGGLPGARWIPPENYHVTLRFIGDVEPPTAARVADALDEVRASPFSLTLSGVGAFGTRQPHSVYAGVNGGPALAELAGEHERLMRRLGLPPETRRFTPHVTVARLKGAAETEVAAWLAARSGFAAPPFAAHRFVLMSSRASKGGGPYVVEAAYPLD